MTSILTSTLTFKALIPDADLVGRVLGPDTFKSYVQVVRVERDEQRHETTAYVRAVGPNLFPFLTRDEFGQLWAPLPSSE